MQLDMDTPDSYTPCYGSQIKYKMPGGNSMYIHFKDKSKIRHKKRWSQVSRVSKYTHLDLLIIYYIFNTKGIKQILDRNSKIDILLCLILKATKSKILFSLSFPFHVFINFE